MIFDKNKKKIGQYELFGHSFAWYFQLVKRRVIYIWLAVLIVRFFTAVPIVDARLIFFTGFFSYGVEFIGYVLLVRFLKKKSDIDQVSAIVLSGVVGSMVGSGVALVEILWYHNLWSLWQLILHPLISASLAGAIATIYLVGRKNNN